MLGRYHYLSHSHKDNAQTFALTVNDELAGMCSYIHFPHERAKNIKKVHRLVVMPDFQGLGLGLFLLNTVAEQVLKAGHRFRITTTNPALIHALNQSPCWKLESQGRARLSRTAKMSMQRASSFHRYTTSWEYVKPQCHGK